MQKSPFVVIVRIFLFYTHIEDMTDQSKKPAIKRAVPKMTREQIREGLKQIPIETILLGTGKDRQLTHKQKQFARNVALGKTKADAYREAYDTKASPKIVGNEGHRLSKRPDIAMEIEAYRLAKEAEEYRNPADLRRLVIHQLTQMALNDEVKDAQRIKSLELLGKVAGVDVFMERKETTVIHQSGDIKARLLNQLKAVIDIDAIETDNAKDSGESLIAELSHRKESEDPPDANGGQADPTLGAPPETGVDVMGSYTHSIPHKQSDSKTNTSASCKNTTPQDVDFIEEKKQVETLPLDDDVEGVPPIDNFWVEKGLEDGERPPVTDWKEKG